MQSGNATIVSSLAHDRSCLGLVDGIASLPIEINEIISINACGKRVVPI